MQLLKARPSDSDRLKAYFADNPLPGPMDLYFKRTESFFTKYELYSKDFVTYFLVDDSNEIHGLASLIFAPGYINGQVETVGYATDLRISNSRKAILSWSQHFLPVLEAERQARNCRFVFSVVAKSQRQAINAFLRPRSTRRPLPRYHLYRRFAVVGLHGKFPWAPPPLKGLGFRSAQEKDTEALYKFLTRERFGLQFPYLPDAKALTEQIQRWKNLDVSSIQIVEDVNDEIVGSFSLWDPSGVEKTFVSDYSGVAQTLYQGLNFFKWTRAARPLSRQGEQLKFKYLTHLRASNSDVFESILMWAWNHTSSDEFILYPHFDGDLTHNPPKSFLSSQWRCGLYCLLSPEDPFPDFFYRSFAETPPYWELSFL